MSSYFHFLFAVYGREIAVGVVISNRANVAVLASVRVFAPAVYNFVPIRAVAVKRTLAATRHKIVKSAPTLLVT
jgi:hypothetical protein